METETVSQPCRHLAVTPRWLTSGLIVVSPPQRVRGGLLGVLGLTVVVLGQLCSAGSQSGPGLRTLMRANIALIISSDTCKRRWSKPSCSELRRRTRGGPQSHVPAGQPGALRGSVGRTRTGRGRWGRVQAFCIPDLSPHATRRLLPFPPSPQEWRILESPWDWSNMQIPTKAGPGTCSYHD